MADRKFEKFENDVWSEVVFENIKKGDRFRSFEPNGTPVESGRIYKALSDTREDGSIQVALRGMENESN